jgi:hypothetical protein
MQIFVDMYGGAWATGTALRPDSPPRSPFERFMVDMSLALQSNGLDPCWLRWCGDVWLSLGCRHGMDIYILIAFNARWGETLATYVREMDALEGVRQWVDYLEGGGTIDAWHAHHQRAINGLNARMTARTTAAHEGPPEHSGVPPSPPGFGRHAL